MWYCAAAALAASLLPITRMDSGEGPMKISPASRTRAAKVAFSDRKP
jgi:hypothetical protein